MKWLFIGNYQSEQRGSYTVSEQIADYLITEGAYCKLVSTSSSKWVRVAQYLCSIFSSNVDRIHIDVFSGRPFLIGYYMAHLFRIRGKRVAATLHGGRLLDYLNDSKSLSKLDVFDILLCPSLKIVQYLNMKGIPVLYQPNPVNISRFIFLPGSKPKGKVRLLWVRAFLEVYNPIVPVLIVDLLVKRGWDAELTMIGPDGGQMRSVQDLVLKLNLESRIYFIGKVKNDVLPSYFQSHDVFLSTSSYESFGMSIIEAALCGIAIVAFPTGEIPFIWSENEIAFPQELKSESYCDTIEQLINNDDWDERLKRARSVAESFDKDKIMMNWINKIESGYNN